MNGPVNIGRVGEVPPGPANLVKKSATFHQSRKKAWSAGLQMDKTVAFRNSIALMQG